LDIEPNDYALSWFGKGNILNSLGRYKEDAVKSFDKAAEIGHDMGLYFINLTRFEDAVKCLDKVIEINPNNVNAWFDKKVNLGL
jgi:tetratricopeptide (TPR) repeat protein